MSNKYSNELDAAWSAARSATGIVQQGSAACSKECIECILVQHGVQHRVQQRVQQGVQQQVEQQIQQVQHTRGAVMSNKYSKECSMEQQRVQIVQHGVQQ